MTAARFATRSPYLHGNYAPTAEEHALDLTLVAGGIPADLRGVFVRNGSNPRFPPPGRYHWFDGDGMIHAVHFTAEGAHYRNRWVVTTGFEAEREAGTALWTGILEPPDLARFPHVFKDTANTDLVWFNGELLALWWLGGDAYRISLPDLETLGIEDFAGTLTSHLAAHPKVDPSTGELLFIDFDPIPPYLTFGVVAPDGRVVRSESIDLGGPRLQHDLAFTDDYAIVFDFPFMWETTATSTRLGFHRDRPSRFGLVPRAGTAVEPIWFETDPCFMYHVANAWQEDGTVRLIGCEVSDPLVDDPDAPADRRAAPEIAMLRLEPYLTEWVLHLDSGTATKRRINDDIAEFPKIDVRRTGRPSRYTYLMRLAPLETLAFDAVIRHDLATGTTSTHPWPEGWYGGETVFCPKEGSTAEDDGYLVTFVVHEATGESEVHVLDAARIDDEPVCRLSVPVRVPTGYHTWWVPRAELEASRPAR